MNNQNYYKKFNHDPTQDAEIVNDTIGTFQRQQVLLKNICYNLKTTKVTTTHLYITLKVLKKDIPGKPVVSSIDCHTSKIFEFVDHYLQPHSKALPSYFQDKTNFMNKLECVRDKSKDSIIVTLDVRALYRNIPNHEGIEAVKETRKNQASKSIPTELLLFLMINFIFNGIN